MMTSADKVGGWVKKGQKHDDVILEWSLRSTRPHSRSFPVFHSGSDAGVKYSSYEAHGQITKRLRI